MCGSATQVLETRGSDSYVVHRRRECLQKKCGYRFSTVEVYTASHVADANRNLKFEQAAQKRIERLQRNIFIAENLFKGWRPLGERYHLTKTAVYLAAAQGRKYLAGSLSSDFHIEKDIS